MKSKKLTNEMQDELISRLMDHAFTKEEKALIEEEKRIAHELYDYQYPKSEQSKMNALPDGWLPKKHYMTVRLPEFGGNNFAFDGESKVFKKNGALRKPVPYNDYVSGCIELLDDTRMYREVRGFLEKKKDLSERRGKYKKEIRGILNSVNTTKQLIDVWPEIEYFVRKVAGDETQRPEVPTVRIQELNQNLGLPPQQKQ